MPSSQLVERVPSSARPSDHMRTALRKCATCDIYTLKDVCPECGRPTGQAAPPRYSPEDRYGEYRRRSIIEEYGENGKCDKVHR